MVPTAKHTQETSGQIKTRLDIAFYICNKLFESSQISNKHLCLRVIKVPEAENKENNKYYLS